MEFWEIELYKKSNNFFDDLYSIACKCYSIFNLKT